MRKNFLLSVFCFGCSFLSAQNVGIGTTTPQSRLHVAGTAWFNGDNTPLSASAGKGIAIGQGGENSYIYAFDYSAFAPRNLILQSPGGNVGIGTLTPANKLTVYSNILGLGGYGIEHTDGTRRLGTFLNSSGGWIGTISNHPLHFFTNDGLQQMTLTQAGQIGIGTTAPTGGYLLDVAGYVKSSRNQSTGFDAWTTGGTNSWARFHMRSNSQSWFIGTSQNFNGNQLYINDETFNHTRFSIQPNNGPIYMQGNLTQDLGGYGSPKAMVFLNGDGTIIRCYNGITGSTSSSGFSSGRIFGTSGYYFLTFPFDISSRFISVTTDSGISFPSSGSFNIFNNTELNIAVTSTVNGANTDRPVMIIVY